jgi:hypothetical protein
MLQHMNHPVAVHACHAFFLFHKDNECNAIHIFNRLKFVSNSTFSFTEILKKESNYNHYVFSSSGAHVTMNMSTSDNKLL